LASSFDASWQNKVFFAYDKNKKNRQFTIAVTICSSNATVCFFHATGEISGPHRCKAMKKRKSTKILHPSINHCFEEAKMAAKFFCAMWIQQPTSLTLFDISNRQKYLHLLSHSLTLLLLPLLLLLANHVSAVNVQLSNETNESLISQTDIQKILDKFQVLSVSDNIQHGKINTTVAISDTINGTVHISTALNDTQLNDNANLCWWKTFLFKELKPINLQLNTRRSNLPLRTFVGDTQEETKRICEADTLCNYFTWNRHNKTVKLYFAKFEDIMTENYTYSSHLISFAIECRCGESDRRVRIRQRRDTYFMGWTTKKKTAPLGFGKGKAVKDKFDSFLKMFKKKYSSAEEALRRGRIFRENLCRIDMFNWKSSLEANQTEQGVTFGITTFADTTSVEFTTQFTGLKQQLPEYQFKIEPEKVSRYLSQVPTAFSWTFCNVVPSVREQGPCGSCYAFSAVDLATAQYWIDHQLWKKAPPEMSPQSIIDCITPPAAYGCEGGRPLGVLKVLSNQSYGIPSEDCYPYELEQDECRKQQCINESTPQPKVQWAKSFNVSGKQEKELIALLTNWGPSIVMIEVPRWMQFYKSGVIKHTQCAKQPEHAVMLVGYNLTSPTPYYLIKNSWGKEWGENGYMRVQAGKNSCGLAENVVITCTKNCDKLDNHDVLLQTSNANICNVLRKPVLRKICFLAWTYG
ncbi:Viral cathepsin, partial [Trichinella spiralis]